MERQTNLYLSYSNVKKVFVFCFIKNHTWTRLLCLVLHLVIFKGSFSPLLILTSSSTMDWRHRDIRMDWGDTTVIHSSLSAATRYSKLNSSLASWSEWSLAPGFIRGLPDVIILQQRILVTLKTTSLISPLGV